MKKRAIVEEAPPRSGRYSVTEWPTNRVIATGCTKEAADRYAKEIEETDR